MIINYLASGIHEPHFLLPAGLSTGQFFGGGRGQNHGGGAGKRSNPPGAGHFRGDAKILSTSPCCGSYQIQLVSPNSASMLLIFGNLIWAKWVALKAAKHFHLLVYFKIIFYSIQYFKSMTILPIGTSQTSK